MTVRKCRSEPKSLGWVSGCTIPAHRFKSSQTRMWVPICYTIWASLTSSLTKIKIMSIACILCSCLIFDRTNFVVRKNQFNQVKPLTYIASCLVYRLVTTCYTCHCSIPLEAYNELLLLFRDHGDLLEELGKFRPLPPFPSTVYSHSSIWMFIFLMPFLLLSLLLAFEKPLDNFSDNPSRAEDVHYNGSKCMNRLMSRDIPVEAIAFLVLCVCVRLRDLPLHTGVRIVSLNLWKNRLNRLFGLVQDTLLHCTIDKLNGRILFCIQYFAK